MAKPDATCQVVLPANVQAQSRTVVVTCNPPPSSNALHVGDWSIPLAIVVLLLSPFVSLAWTLVSLLVKEWFLRYRAYRQQIIVQCPIDLTWLRQAHASLLAAYKAESPDNDGSDLIAAQLYCLLVRFGTDEYLSNLASDQDKYEGRLQNKVIQIDLDQSSPILTLPVHARLGSQFKMYVLMPSSDSAVRFYDVLKLDPISRVSKDKDLRYKILLDGDPPDGRKLWFKLGAYGDKKTIDQYSNNFYGASRVKHFEKRNRWKRGMLANVGFPDDPNEGQPPSS